MLNALVVKGLLLYLFTCIRIMVYANAMIPGKEIQVNSQKPTN